MDSPLEWISAVVTIVAAALVALNAGRKVTGGAFILYSLAAAGWIVSALQNDSPPLAIQNGILLAIDFLGIYQYLLNPTKKKVIEKVERYEAKVEKEVKAEEAAA